MEHRPELGHIGGPVPALGEDQAAKDGAGQSGRDEVGLQALPEILRYEIPQHPGLPDAGLH